MEMAIGGEWTRLGLRQLSGMLILVYVRSQFLVRPKLPCPLDVFVTDRGVHLTWCHAAPSMPEQVCKGMLKYMPAAQMCCHERASDWNPSANGGSEG